MTIVGGADGCPGGWVCIERDAISGDIFADVFASTREMMERARHLAVLTVDIPIMASPEAPLGDRRRSVWPRPAAIT